MHKHFIRIENRYTGEIFTREFDSMRNAALAFRLLVGDRSVRHAELLEQFPEDRAPSPVQSYTPGWLDDEH